MCVDEKKPNKKDRESEKGQITWYPYMHCLYFLFIGLARLSLLCLFLSQLAFFPIDFDGGI